VSNTAVIKPRETSRESPSRIGVCANFVWLDEIGDTEPRSGCNSAWGPNADRHHKSLIDLPSVGSMLGADSHSGPPGCGKTLCAEPFVPSFARYRSAHSF
jgi:hypothetical protein